MERVYKSTPEQRARALAYYYANKTEVRQKLNKAYAEDPEKRKRNRAYSLDRKFGMTLDQYDSLLKSQGGVCAICGTDVPGGRVKNFHVDHDHSTGEIRGLLCTGCNTGLGNLKDDPAVIEKALLYLRKHNGSNL